MRCPVGAGELRYLRNCFHAFRGGEGAHRRISPLQGSDGVSSPPRALPEAVVRCPVGAGELHYLRNCFHAKVAQMPAGACADARFSVSGTCLWVDAGVVLAIEACSFSRDIRSVRRGGRGPLFPRLLALLGQPRVPVPICHFQKKIRNAVRIGI